MNDICRTAIIATVMCIVSVCGSASFAANNETNSTRQQQTLLHDGIERSYVAYVPQSVTQRGGLAPLGLVLHGGGGNADNAEKMTGFTDEAEKEGFIVVYPVLGHASWYAYRDIVDAGQLTPRKPLT